VKNNENIEWHCVQLELNWNEFQFNSNSMESNSELFQFNWKEISCKLVHKVLKRCSSLPPFGIIVFKNISFKIDSKLEFILVRKNLLML
jgi:hypothetical protein